MTLPYRPNWGRTALHQNRTAWSLWRVRKKRRETSVILPYYNPLERHPDWVFKSPETSRPSSFFYDKGAIGVIDNRDAVRNIAYKPDTTFGEAGVMEADIYYTSSNSDWFSCAAKFIDDNNIVGIRNHNGNAEVVQRVGGSWSTIYSQSPELSGRVTVTITSNTIIVVQNGVELFNVVHQISAAGFYGLSGHNAHFTGPIVKFHSISAISEQEIPCMTSDNTPYGEVTAGAHLSSYLPYKGMDCVISNADAWLTPSPTDNIDDAWLQWFFADAIPMIPVRFQITPRGGSTADWYLDNNPQALRVFGVNQDGSLEQVWEKLDLADWGDGSSRSWDISGVTKAYYGIRVRILSTNRYENDGWLHSGWSDLRVWGIPIDYADRVMYKGEYVTHNSEYVTYSKTSFLDIDHDSLPDEARAGRLGDTNFLTEDEDSYNLDLDGDGNADIILPK